MIYILAVFLPPLALLLNGQIFSAILNVFLTLLLWRPGVRHAQFVLYQHLDDKRARLMASATHRPDWTKTLQPVKPAQSKQPKPVIEVIDQPDVGMNGTRFRKRCELN